jgi:DNA excision repair protein ERCC-2
MLKKFARSKDTIVVFDEAHNIDDVCLESYTLKINNQIINSSANNLRDLQGKIDLVKEQNKEIFKTQLGKMMENYKDKLGTNLGEK